MARQHATPLFIRGDGTPAVALVPLSLAGGPDGVSEAYIQQLIQEHPSCLPIDEIDPLFANPVPICTELNTPAGPIDNFMVTPAGLPVLVECKLWRNPEMRRKAAGSPRTLIQDEVRTGPWTDPAEKEKAFARLRERTNDFLNVLRPRLRAAAADLDLESR